MFDNLCSAIPLMGTASEIAHAIHRRVDALSSSRHEVRRSVSSEVNIQGRRGLMSYKSKRLLNDLHSSRYDLPSRHCSGPPMVRSEKENFPWMGGTKMKVET